MLNPNVWKPSQQQLLANPNIACLDANAGFILTETETFTETDTETD